MSETQEFSAKKSENKEKIVELPKGETGVHNLKEIEQSLDHQSYFVGEVPQPQLFDPHAVLPLNSDKLIGPVNMVEKLLFEVGLLIEEQLAEIQKHQKKIAYWEDRVEKNKAALQHNQLEIKKHTAAALYDKKNRDYWFNRAEEVELDFLHAQVTNRQQDWAWLIKKYGLKNGDGTEIDSKAKGVEEICNGEAMNLSSGYRATGQRYEISRKDREAEIQKLVSDNGKLLNTNDTLHSYSSAAYSNQIEALQDGVLLLKELGVKLKDMSQDEKTSYGDLRGWAEPFLNDFIRTNHRVHQGVVTHFRRLTSIPLPPENC